MLELPYIINKLNVLLVYLFFFFFLMIRRHTRSTLFPYTTLFRSRARPADCRAGQERAGPASPSHSSGAQRGAARALAPLLPYLERPPRSPGLRRAVKHLLSSWPALD